MHGAAARVAQACGCLVGATCSSNAVPPNCQGTPPHVDGRAFPTDPLIAIKRVLTSSPMEFP
eukprot:4161742-Pyramimonas_sp.AAC.1